jgi:hypothetical protein
MLLLLAVASCGDSGLRAIPEPLQGYWATDDDPRYADRLFCLQSKAVLFGVGDGQYAAHAVESIDTTQTAGETLYTVRYGTSAGLVFMFQFRYSEEPEPVIHFQNQPQIAWHQVPDPFLEP